MQAVFAYLDPGSGSMLLQILLGGAAAAGVGLKMTWRRLLGFLHLGGKKPERDSEAPAAN